MAIPTIDTFEHDIAEEIKNKEASLTDIASAGGDLGNTPPQAKTSRLVIFAGVACIITVIAGGAGLWYYASKTSAVVTEDELVPAPSGPDLSSLSPALQQALADHVGKVTSSEYGYTISITNFTPVYAYMLKNESQYADDIAKALGVPRDTSASSTPFVFTDVTLSNQNMRVGTSGSSTIVYGFANSQTLLIASGTESILKLRNAILVK